MIITRLCGGLGNQMFQYAAGRKLALLRNTKLKLDLFCYAIDTFRTFDLDNACINACAATPWDIFRLWPSEGLRQMAHHCGPRSYRTISLLLQRLSRNEISLKRYSGSQLTSKLQPLLKGKVAEQRFFHFDKELFTCPTNTYLYGYWLSYRFFEDIRSVLLKEFYPIEPISKRATDILNLISSCISVGLHIRRTDKVGNKDHPAVDASFYNKAIDYYEQKYGGVNFFCFSDDISWAKQHFARSNVFFIEDSTAKNAFEDMWLMSRCQHTIVPCSSFSWWAAWLNEFPEKDIVIAPRRFWSTNTNYNLNDISPPEWRELTY